MTTLERFAIIAAMLAVPDDGHPVGMDGDRSFGPVSHPLEPRGDGMTRASRRWVIRAARRRERRDR